MCLSVEFEALKHSPIKNIKILSFSLSLPPSLSLSIYIYRTIMIGHHLDTLYGSILESEVTLWA